jgi:hypothetical protein
MRSTSKRINIILPETTLRAISKIAKPGDRSKFIDRAVQHYIATQSVEALRSRLEQAAIRDRDIDRKIAGEWQHVDQQIWQRLDKTEDQRKPSTRSAGRSTSHRSIRA